MSHGSVLCPVATRIQDLLLLCCSQLLLLLLAVAAAAVAPLQGTWKLLGSGAAVRYAQDPELLQQDHYCEGGVCCPYWVCGCDIVFHEL